MEGNYLVAAVVGGVIATAPLFAKLIFDWVQNDSERKFRLRRDVYLEACEGAGHGVSQLTAFGNVNIPDDELTGRNKHRSWDAKVQTVASFETVKALVKATEFHTMQILELAPRRVEIRRLDMELETLRDAAQQARDQQQQLTTFVENIPKAKPSVETLAVIPGLIERYTEARTRADQIANEVAELQHERFRLARELSIAGAAAARKYSILLAHVIVEIRKELSLETDKEWYIKTAEESADRINAALQSALKRVDNGRDT